MLLANTNYTAKDHIGIIICSGISFEQRKKLLSTYPSLSAFAYPRLSFPFSISLSQPSAFFHLFASVRIRFSIHLRGIHFCVVANVKCTFASNRARIYTNTHTHTFTHRRISNRAEQFAFSQPTTRRKWFCIRSVRRCQCQQGKMGRDNKSVSDTWLIFRCDIDWLPFIMAYGLWGENDMVYHTHALTESEARWVKEKKWLHVVHFFSSLPAHGVNHSEFVLRIEILRNGKFDTRNDSVICKIFEKIKPKRRIQENFIARNEQFSNSSIWTRVSTHFFAIIDRFGSGRPQCGNSVIHSLLLLLLFLLLLMMIETIFYDSWKTLTTHNSYIHEMTTNPILCAIESGRIVVTRDDRRDSARMAKCVFEWQTENLIPAHISILHQTHKLTRTYTHTMENGNEPRFSLWKAHVKCVCVYVCDGRRMGF